MRGVSEAWGGGEWKVTPGLDKVNKVRVSAPREKTGPVSSVRRGGTGALGGTTKGAKGREVQACKNYSTTKTKPKGWGRPLRGPNVVLEVWDKGGER